MAVWFIVLILALVCTAIPEIECHGMMIDPPNRSSAWRYGFRTPINNDDNQNYCGSLSIHYQKNGGKCGPCGDSFSDRVPRKNENGGLYGTGTIVKTYTAGSTIDVKILLTASHYGHFEFSLCPLKGNAPETNECFDRYPLNLAGGGRQYKITSPKRQTYTIKLSLPRGFTCERCSLRWHYRTGNSWGICPDGTGSLGCGNQEWFRTCTDIKIK